MVLQDLVSSQQLLNLIITELCIVLFSHLLFSGSHFRYGFVFSQHFVVLALLNEPPILNFSMWICLWIPVACVSTLSCLAESSRRLGIPLLGSKRLDGGGLVQASGRFLG